MPVCGHSGNRNEVGAQQVDLAASVHLSSDDLELGNLGVVEVATGHSATAAIWLGTASIVGGVSSAVASVCM